MRAPTWVGVPMLIGLIALAATLAPQERNSIEQVMDALPLRSKVLIVVQGLFLQHPECPEPVEGDWRSVGSLLVDLMKRELMVSRNRGKVLAFDLWDVPENDLTQEHRERIVRLAQVRSDTHVLYLQATKKYQWDDEDQSYTLAGIDWTFRLVDLAVNRIRFIQGFVTAPWFQSRPEPITVSCEAHR